SAASGASTATAALKGLRVVFSLLMFSFSPVSSSPLARPDPRIPSAATRHIGPSRRSMPYRGTVPVSDVLRHKRVLCPARVCPPGARLPRTVARMVFADGTRVSSRGCVFVGVARPQRRLGIGSDHQRRDQPGDEQPCRDPTVPAPTRAPLSPAPGT